MRQDGTTSPSTPRDRARSWILGLTGYSTASGHNAPDAKCLADVRERLSKLTGDEAQDVIDFLDELLRTENLEGDKRRRTLDLLRKTVKSTQIVPKRLLLSDVEFNPERSLLAAISGIFRGKYNNEDVYVEVIQTGSSSASNSFLKEHAGDFIVSANIAHDNILPFYGVSNPEVRHGSSLVMVFKWMEQVNLKTYLKKKPQTPRIPLIADIISGLDYLHGMNILHANLEGSNIHISNGGHALLVNFPSITQVDLTRPTSPSSSGPTQSRLSQGTTRWPAPELMDTGAPKLMSTIYWTAPEIVTTEIGVCPPSTTSDVWSFACTCYEVVTGFTPFYELRGDGGDVRLLRAMNSRKIPSLRVPIVVHDKSNEAALSTKIQTLLSSCWKYTPTERPSAAEIKDFISELDYTDNRAPLQNPHSADTGNPQTSPSVVTNYNRVYNIFLQA